MKHTPNIDMRIFRDVDKESIDFERDASFVISRVFNYGALEDIRNTRIYYGPSSIKSGLRASKDLSTHTLSLASGLFTLPKEQFACYTKKQLNQQLWSY